MNDIRVFRRTHQRLETRGGQLCQVIKVLACGCMVGTAILFPLANVGDLWFRCAQVHSLPHRVGSSANVKAGPFLSS
jgi:hypothetical protein